MLNAFWTIDCPHCGFVDVCHWGAMAFSEGVRHIIDRKYDFSDSLLSPGDNRTSMQNSDLLTPSAATAAVGRTNEQQQQQEKNRDLFMIHTTKPHLDILHSSDWTYLETWTYLNTDSLRFSKIINAWSGLCQFVVSKLFHRLTKKRKKKKPTTDVFLPIFFFRCSRFIQVAPGHFPGFWLI